MDAQRLTDRLTNYWNLLRKEEAMPDFACFNTSAIADIWQQCILLTVQPAAEGTPPAVNFYLVGEKVKSLSSNDMTGRQVTAVQRPFQGAAIVRRVQEVIAKPEAVYDAGQFVNDQSKIVKYRSCLLPFGGKDGKVTHIVVGLSWREF